MQSSQLANEAVQSRHLGEEVVQGANLAAESVESRHLSDGAVTAHHISLEAVNVWHLSAEIQQHGLLPEEGLGGEDIQPSSIGRVHLQPGAVDAGALAEGVVGEEHLQEGAVGNVHLAPNAVGSSQLANEAVGTRHLQPGSVGMEQLSFAPIQTMSGQPAELQFGMVAFLLKHHEVETTVTISFDSPFTSSNYVVVAMTNHAAYSASLKEQSAESAVITISKLKESNVNYGFVTWIAIGNTL
ncbi:hypothetical protein D3C74_229330 [compost metagenome]